MKNIRIFYLKIFLFLVVKFSVYLNRHVFVMYSKNFAERPVTPVSIVTELKKEYNSYN